MLEPKSGWNLFNQVRASASARESEGAVVLDGGVAAIAITVFGKTVFVLLRVCGRGYFGSWKGFFCVVIGKVCLREQFLINLICRDSASILRVELLA
jgi:hypothetical protein